MALVVSCHFATTFISSFPSSHQASCTQATGMQMYLAQVLGGSLPVSVLLAKEKPIRLLADSLLWIPFHPCSFTHSRCQGTVRPCLEGVGAWEPVVTEKQSPAACRLEVFFKLLISTENFILVLNSLLIPWLAV